MVKSNWTETMRTISLFRHLEKYLAQTPYKNIGKFSRETALPKLTFLTSIAILCFHVIIFRLMWIDRFRFRHFLTRVECQQVNEEFKRKSTRALFIDIGWNKERWKRLLTKFRFLFVNSHTKNVNACTTNQRTRVCKCNVIILLEMRTEVVTFLPSQLAVPKLTGLSSVKALK
jgi:hypothetical protein